MNKNFEKLLHLLKELFQLDQPDLDFGLYRIMHAKAAEISQFLDKDLLPQVNDAFSQYKTADKAELEIELRKAIEQAHSLGVDPESTAKVKKLKQKIADDSVDVAALENEVYDHLFGFFRRYYHEGDYLAKRVYKPGVYAIPYEGEEVKLHWANHDQYYIKSTEYLRDYAFTLKSSNSDDPMRVHFRLIEAFEGEHDNVKAENRQERVFILAPDDSVGLGHRLIISQPDSDGGEFDEGEIVFGVFFVSRCNCPEVFDLAEETLDTIAVSIEEGAEGRYVLAVWHRLHARPGTARVQTGTHCV